MNRRIGRWRIALTLILGLGGFALATNVGAGFNRWTVGAPGVGGVDRLVIDAGNSDVVYAATPKGVFKTSNGGQSWRDPSGGKLDGFKVHSLAMDPRDPSRLIAGTGRGVLQSRDGGSSWNPSLAANSIYDLLFASQPSTIYAADLDDVSYYPDPSTIYQSTDDGETWIRKPAGFAILSGSLIVHPTQPSTLYAAGYDDFWAVYRSVDGASTWQALSPDLRGLFVTALAIDRQDPSRFYAAAYGGIQGILNGIYKSEDAGSTWQVASRDVVANWVTVLAVDPRDSKTLYAATYNGVFRSSDGGASWRGVNSGLPALDIVALTVDSTGRTLHAGSRTIGVFDYQISTGAVDLSVAADGKARLLLAEPDGGVGIRAVDRQGGSSRLWTSGPYAHWDSRAVAEGPDGLTRVLWDKFDGTAALWLAGPEGNRVSYLLGPVAGWTAVDVASSAAGETDVLWTNPNGRMALWRVDNTGRVSTGSPYGPYPDWTAVAVAGGRDESTRVLWKRTDGSAAVSIHGPEGLLASHPFGPVAGWTATDIAVGADGQTRLLWTHQDGRMTLWRVDDAGHATAVGPVYSPPASLAAIRVAAGADGLTRVLWADLEGAAVLWLLSADNVLIDSVTLNPDSLDVGK